MKEQDKLIKNVLESKMQTLADESFTQNIIDEHLKRRKTRKTAAFFDFGTFLWGFAALLVFTFLGILINSNIPFEMEIPITTPEIILLIFLSLAFMIFRVLDELVRD